MRTEYTNHLYNIAAQYPAAQATIYLAGAVLLAAIALRIIAPERY